MMILVNGFKHSIGGAPVVINDGNTVAWYRSDEPTTITKDLDNKVSQWRDYLGSTRNLNSPNADSVPTWSTSGIEFNGLFNYMTANFTLNQPEFTYAVLQIFTGSAGTLYCGANSGGNCPVYINNISGSVATLTMEGSGGSVSGGNAPINQFIILRTLFNGANSKMTINNLAPNTGNAGSSPLTGITLGSNLGVDYVGSFSRVQFKEIILRKIWDNSTNETEIFNYLKNKYSL